MEYSSVRGVRVPGSSRRFFFGSTTTVVALLVAGSKVTVVVGVAAGWNGATMQSIPFRYIAGSGAGAVDEALSLLCVVGPASIILRDAARATSLGAYLASVAQVNPTYAALRNAALHEAQANGTAPSPRLLANLERARAIPAEGRFILVDAAAQRLWMY